MANILSFAIDKEIKLRFEEKVKRYGFNSAHDTLSYLIENYINFFNGGKIDPEMKRLIEIAPRQLVTKGHRVYLTGRMSIGKAIGDWGGTVQELAKGTDYKTYSNLCRNMIYAFIVLGDKDTLDMGRAIESYRLRGRTGVFGKWMRTRLSERDIRRIHDIYGDTCCMGSIFRNAIRLLIDHEDGVSCSRYSDLLYQEFMSGHSVVMVRGKDKGEDLRLAFCGLEDRRKITLLAYNADTRGPACFLRRVCHALLHVRDMAYELETIPVEDTYEEDLFRVMARKDYGFQNYRR